MTQSKIMIVEDESIVSKNIDRHLRKMNYDVCALVTTGEEAIEKALELKPHLVLMDIRLSGELDGVQAAQQIRKSLDIPIIFLTAYTDEETFQRAKITDPYAYILKPFDPSKLHTAIEIALYRHQMEKKLKESELRFRTLATSAPVGIFQTDINGDCIYVNPCWCKFAGMTAEEAKGKGWSAALHPDDREDVFKVWYEMALSGADFSKEYRFLSKQGKITWLYAYATPLKDEEGARIGYIGTITDISMRKDLEEKRLTHQKLEALGILAGGIAHDFNNLLSIITGNISMLKMDDNLVPAQHVTLDKIEHTATQAAELSQKLITFSRGRWLNRKPLHVKSLFQDVIEQHFPTLSNTTHVNMDLTADVKPIDGDEIQMKQVFFNILLNAREALENVSQSQKGVITIAASNQTVPQADIPLEEWPYVKISVQDNGSGIQPSVKGKIFDPYFTTKPMGPQKGLGLGLTICFSVIRKHGGYIRAVSPAEENGIKGTRIEMYLPMHSGKETLSEETGTSGSDEKKVDSPGRILVIDDDLIIQDVISQMLKRLGFEAVICDEGSQALEEYRAAEEAGTPFDIMLIDLINKKGMGGIETLSRLRAQDPSMTAVPIALSGFSDQSDMDELRKDGFRDILVKPFKWKDMKEVIDRYFQKL